MGTSYNSYLILLSVSLLTRRSVKSFSRVKLLLYGNTQGFYDYFVQSYRHPDLVKKCFVVYITCFVAFSLTELTEASSG